MGIQPHAETKYKCNEAMAKDSSDSNLAKFNNIQLKSMTRVSASNILILYSCNEQDPPIFACW